MPTTSPAAAAYPEGPANHTVAKPGQARRLEEGAGDHVRVIDEFFFHDHRVFAQLVHRGVELVAARQLALVRRFGAGDERISQVVHIALRRACQDDAAVVVELALPCMDDDLCCDQQGVQNIDQQGRLGDGSEVPGLEIEVSKMQLFRSNNWPILP